MLAKVEKLNIYKDDRYLIHMCKDHWGAMVIQVARFGPKSMVNEKGQIVESRAPYIVWTRSIPTIEDPMNKARLDPVPGDKFRKAVDDAVKAAKAQLDRLKNLDKMMDGVLIDYASAYAEFNKDQAFASAVEAEKAMKSGK